MSKRLMSGRYDYVQEVTVLRYDYVQGVPVWDINTNVQKVHVYS